MDAVTEVVWQFIRGDLPPARFEQWACTRDELETLLGPARYLTLVSADFRDRDEIHRTRRWLAEYLRTSAPMQCECVALPNTAVLGMGSVSPALDTLQTQAERGEPYWWLSYSQCHVCGTSWLVAQEERQNDVFILRRLDDEEAGTIVSRHRWPSYFDSYATLLEIGRAAGHSVRFLDPIGDSSLSWTMADLARDQPGISLADLSRLLNLDLSTAAVIARQAIDRHGVEIDLHVDFPR